MKPNAQGLSADHIAAELTKHASVRFDGVSEHAALVGEPGQRLMTVVTAPADPKAAAAVGIVICHSFFEMKMLQGAELALLRQAATAGIPGSYVEAPGMGDSEGDPGACTVEARTAAALRAARHLRAQVPGVDRVCFVGARFGAAIAVLAAARHDGPSALALWDPPLNAAEYWKHTRRFARVVAALGRTKREDPDKQLDREGKAVVVGYTITSAMRDDLSRIDDIHGLAPLACPGLLIGLNEALVRSARGQLRKTIPDLEHVSLGAPRPQNLIRLRISDAQACIAPTVDWITRRLT